MEMKSEMKKPAAAAAPVVGAQKTGAVVKMELNVENVKKLAAENTPRKEMLKIFGLGEKEVYPLRKMMKEAGLLSARRAPKLMDVMAVYNSIKDGSAKNPDEVEAITNLDKGMVRTAIKQLTAEGYIQYSLIAIK